MSRVLLPLLLAVVTPAAAQTAAAQEKMATAARVPTRAIQLDGRLDEAEWQRAAPLTDFVQKEPVEGAQPSDRTEVRFLFDDEALWVGARLSSGDGRVQAPMSRRDNVEQADYILVSLDTYLDRRTAYSFGVAASGVRLDHYHPADNEGNRETEFDPVWEARVAMEDGGWTAEMWIPFTQLRFTDRPEQVWGLNVHRWTPARNEDDYWVAVPRTERGWSSRFGELRGIAGIEPSRRIELLPYVAGGSTVTGDQDALDPFDDGRNLEGRVGADLKMGLGPNFTVDATINPDFGQVESDPAVVNLTAFESFFQERRPFFTEGIGLISGRMNNLFYSRRIGAAPIGRASGDYVDYPKSTTILGATKLTGRTPAGLSVAGLAAVTDGEHARTFDVETGAFGRVPVAPRTAWAAGRVQQEFGADGSTASLFLGAVRRDLPEGDALAALLTRSAVTVGLESVLRLGGGGYEIVANAGMTHIRGDSAALLRVQRASQRYFQRPDADHVELDPSRTDMTGVKVQVTAERTGGRHWLWDLFLELETPTVEFNDIGRLSSGDALGTRAGLTYRETEPGRLFRSWRVSLGERTEWNFGRDLQIAGMDADASVTWSNFWSTRAGFGVGFRAQDQRLTRGGPSMGTPFGWSASLGLNSPGSAQTRWDAGVNGGRDELGGWSASVGGGVTMQPAPQWQLSLRPSYDREVASRQYVTTSATGGAATFGARYVFAFVDRTTLSTEARVNFTLKPDLNLDVYAEPFAASGRYYDFGELRAPRSRSLRTYGTEGTAVSRLPDGDLRVADGPASFVVPDQSFNVRSFRSTSVLRWEWRPGSTLYLVWQQDRSRERDIATRAGWGDMLASVATAGDNFFAVKASFWLPR